MIVSVTIGIAGAVLGGDVPAPMRGASMASRGDFNPHAMFVAFASAAGCLIIGDMICKGFGV